LGLGDAEAVANANPAMNKNNWKGTTLWKIQSVWTKIYLYYRTTD